MSPTMTVDLSKVGTPIQSFPNGVYHARVDEASLDIAESSGAPIINMQLTIYDEDLGEGQLRDSLPSKFPAKCKAFWQAVNGFSAEDMKRPENSNVEFDADALVGATLLVQLGEREGTNKKGEKTMYKQAVGAWYFPESRTDLIGYTNGD